VLPLLFNAFESTTIQVQVSGSCFGKTLCSWSKSIYITREADYRSYSM
jgi:hypothetical protein